MQNLTTPSLNVHPVACMHQAGHVDVVSFLLNKVRTIIVDPVNNLGFSPLMKAALQGRIKCSKLLLFSGRRIIIRITERKMESVAQL